MGFLDDAKDKLTEAVDKHGDKVAEGIDKAAELLDDKTDGNPFFIEEVLRSLQERGLIERRGDEIGLVQPTATIDVPDSVEDVLLGRLQRLDASP